MLNYVISLILLLNINITIPNTQPLEDYANVYYHINEDNSKTYRVDCFFVTSPNVDVYINEIDLNDNPIRHLLGTGTPTLFGQTCYYIRSYTSSGYIYSFEFEAQTNYKKVEIDQFKEEKYLYDVFISFLSNFY